LGFITIQRLQNLGAIDQENTSLTQIINFLWEYLIISRRFQQIPSKLVTNIFLGDIFGRFLAKVLGLHQFFEDQVESIYNREQLEDEHDDFQTHQQFWIMTQIEVHQIQDSHSVQESFFGYFVRLPRTIYSSPD
jgi:hypothetical protein